MYTHVNTTFGTDIEYALTDEYGEYKAAIPFIKGSKSKPQLLARGNMQKDNVAFEVAIDYSSYPDVALGNIRSVLHEAAVFVPAGWNMNAIPSAMYPEEELQHPIAKEFGCEPDFDAKTGKVNEIDRSTVDPHFRSFGLHIHTGYNHYKYDKSHELIRYHILASDFVLGLLSTILDNSEAALNRRMLYGFPSAYRPKPYGVEYRTLSNFWSKSPYLMELIMQLNDYVTWLAKPHRIGKQFLRDYDVYQICDIIKDGNKNEAYNIFMKTTWPNLTIQTRSLINRALETPEDGYGTLHHEWALDAVNSHKVSEEDESQLCFKIKIPAMDWANYERIEALKAG